jgi:hypothetical protein
MSFYFYLACGVKGLHTSALHDIHLYNTVTIHDDDDDDDDDDSGGDDNTTINSAITPTAAVTTTNMYYLFGNLVFLCCLTC